MTIKTSSDDEYADPAYRHYYEYLYRDNDDEEWSLDGVYIWDDEAWPLEDVMELIKIVGKRYSHTRQYKDLTKEKYCYDPMGNPWVLDICR